MIDEREKALVQAARDQKEGLVRTYVQSGVNPNCCDDGEYTALHWAVVQPNGLGVLLTLLRSSEIDINKTNAHGRTALIIAAGKGNEAAVHNLLAKKADVSCQDEWGCTALHYAQQYGSDKLVAMLSKAARATANNRRGGSSIGLPVVHKDTAEIMLLRVLESNNFELEIKEKQLKNVLTGKITNMRYFLHANFLLHLLKKTENPVMSYFCDFTASGEYLLEHVYYQVAKVKLREGEKLLVGRAAAHAERRKLIRAGKAVEVREKIKVQDDIRFLKEQLRNVANEVLRELRELDIRVIRVEKVSSEAWKLAKELEVSDQRIRKDLAMMYDYLNKLHKALKKKEQRDIYIGIARFVLSAIPVVGNMLGNAADMSIEIMCGFTVGDMVDIMKGGISAGFAIDVTDGNNLTALTSQSFLSNLSARDREVMKRIGQESKFKGLENISRKLEAALKPGGSSSHA